MLFQAAKSGSSYTKRLLHEKSPGLNFVRELHALPSKTSKVPANNEREKTSESGDVPVIEREAEGVDIFAYRRQGFCPSPLLMNGSGRFVVVAGIVPSSYFTVVPLSSPRIISRCDRARDLALLHLSPSLAL